MFKQTRTIVLLALLILSWMICSANVAAERPKLYSRDNLLAAGNYNDGTSSSDITLIIQVEVDGNILIDEGSPVKYIVPQEDVEGWTEAGFDDSNWEDGVSGVGYSDGDDNTPVPGGNVASIYTRYYFDVPSASSVNQITVRVDYDDGYILWLNGVEIARSSTMAPVSATGDIPSWDVSAVRGAMGHHGASELAAGRPNENRWKHGEIEMQVIGVEFGGQTPSLIQTKGSRKIANVQIWDTLSPFPTVGARHAVPVFDVRDKTDWTIVPAGTGREHRPKGDIVLENKYLTAIFFSKSGKVIVYSKSGKKRAELTPLQLKGKAANITSCKILRNTDDEATVEAYFSAKETGKNLPAIFSFSKKQIIEVKPAENMKGMSLLSPIEFAIVPSFIGDDLIFDPRDHSSFETLYIPSENLFLGLLSGEDGMLVITWSKGKQEMRLTLKGGRFFESVDLENDGKRIYLAILDAPGIWHKEELKSSYLEKDVAIDWKRPFPAKWITQLYEDGVKTTYPFKEHGRTRVISGVRTIWRGGVGSYPYPVRFEGEKALYHLGKKIPPKGESLIYFLESGNTPASVSTPVDIMKQALDNQTYESILDFEGRKGQAAHRPNTVVGGATCGVTDKFKPIFKAGIERERKEYIKAGIEDMMSHLTILTERANRYQDFAHEMIEFLTLTKKDEPKSKPFLDKMENITKEIIAAYEHGKGNIKDLEYARKLAKETQALTQRKSSDNFAAFMELKGKWTGMGGSLEALNRKLHTTARKLFQEAGYSCVEQRETVKIAEEIRRRTKKFLRNPNEYEIWSNY